MHRLSRQARHDLRAVYTRGAEMFGLEQADAYAEGLEKTFRFLADYPRAARERLEVQPPVRAHPYKSHLVVYEIVGDDIVIVRIRHGHEDWQSASR